MAVFPYLIAYLGAGFLLACGFLINNRIPWPKRFLVAGIMMALWPIFAFAIPGSFFKPSKEEAANRNGDRLSIELKKILQEHSEHLAQEVKKKIANVAEDGERSVSYFGAPGGLEDVLQAFWDEKIPPSIYYKLLSARADLEEREPYDGPLFSRRPPDWYVGFSHEFLKCIAKADGKLRGRILDAIGKLSEAPMEAVGDTVKPLTSNLSGLWRYRIGDDRLVYFPDHEEKKITLIFFGARGDVYKKVSPLDS
jgi:mRNA-degrading endonuclease RelE of RelBE toxin-antitoxin system